MTARDFSHELRRADSLKLRLACAGLWLMAASMIMSIVFLLADWRARLAMAAGGLMLGFILWRIPSRDAPGARGEP